MIDENETVVTLSDLKQLGKQGGATALLEDGTLLTLRGRHATRRTKGYVDGILKEIDVIIPYPKILNQIRTIKSQNTLVARRINRQSPLRLTGRGYHRKGKE
ncbi:MULTISPECIES: hypothetical protein [Streptococcus]|uniref:Uncharacterized protein n=2 Tax=Streptococcus dysgalactiae subsp. equisimilis TaxID=119602 RepID=A0AAE9R4W6_STREQ|nr:hypothetical protein [Streptococcus dysgalactiae]HEP5052606.1 hypothetical protein [Streptococcus pyogenes]QQC50076.1 hypothetical protein I6H74_02600 [Streptococcus dysgalactiae]SQF77514.1 Uncharacterised protein [Streptococcus dysgalactiae subsp. equisimilis]SUN67088.1 Uncharacterised protein [Streptococcus dysgalactiae subsp. equisimilis]VTT14129.1 Uncharacterised protein [Streptococcus dysgalactiae subsp. equisimilis]